MDFLSNNIRSGDLAPVLLGYSATADKIAHRLFHRYRLISHVFCERMPFRKRFSLSMKFHIIHGFSYDELLLSALEDFADTVRNTDVILCLIPATERAASLVDRHRERLESRYVIASPDAIRNPALL